MCWSQRKNYKKRANFLKDLPPESSSETTLIPQNMVKVMFSYFHAVIFYEKNIETQNSYLSRLNNLETRISGFAENLILVRASFGTKLGGFPASF